jgi:H+/gluconate symporter-like permease
MAIAIGSICLYSFIIKDKKTVTETLKKGLVDWVMPLLSFSIVVGFGIAVQQTAGFDALVDIVVNIGGSPYVSAALAVALLSGFTGSASGGISIALSSEKLVQSWLADGGVNHAALHRIISVSSCSLDSLPHCGGILANLNVCKETHARSYKHIFVVTVIIPLFAAAVIVGLALAGLTI